jgi:hypothetical protein
VNAATARRSNPTFSTRTGWRQNLGLEVGKGESIQ